MSYVATATRTFANNAAIGKHLRVTLSSGFLAAAGIGVKDLGTMEYASLATDTTGTVRMRSAEGSVMCVASKAIAAGAEVYTAAAGKVSDTKGVGAFSYGTAVTAASADGSYIEVIPNAHGDTAGT